MKHFDIFGQFLIRPPFQNRRLKLDPNMCFVLMPFGDKVLDAVWTNHLQPAVRAAGLEPLRADQIFSDSPVMDDVWTCITNSRLVIADLTGRNPNVFYELGIAHTIGKNVVQIAQDISDVPFDIRHIRTILYEYTPPGMTGFEKALTDTCKHILSSGVEYNQGKGREQI